MQEPQVPSLAVSSSWRSLSRSPLRPCQLCPSLTQGSLLEPKIPCISIFIQQLSIKGSRPVFFFSTTQKGHTKTQGGKGHRFAPSHQAHHQPPALGPSRAAIGSLGFATWSCPNPVLTSSLPMSHDDMKNWAAGDLPHAICHLSVPGDPGH